MSQSDVATKKAAGNITIAQLKSSSKRVDLFGQKDQKKAKAV